MRHISHYSSYKTNAPYVIKGFIDSQPVTKNKKSCFIFKVKEIQFNDFRIGSCGDVLVHAKTGKDFYYGETLTLAGKLYRPFRGKFSGRNSYRDYLYNNGIFSIMDARVIKREDTLNQGMGLAFRHFIFRLKEKVEKIIFKRVSRTAAGILDAMILGEKANIPKPLYGAMIKSGTVHILVVSGFNVGIVAFIITLLFRLARIPKSLRFYMAGLLLITYCMITQAAAPVVRATIMAIVFMFAYFVKREADIYNTLSLAALFILGINPGQLFDIGFELSFISVISIVYFFPKLKSLLYTERLKVRPLRFLVDCSLVSFSAWFGTAGFIAYYFGIISPVTVLANILIVPLSALITLCGFTLVIMELTMPCFAKFFALPCEFSVSLLLKINAFLIKIPFAYFSLTNSTS